MRRNQPKLPKERDLRLWFEFLSLTPATSWPTHVDQTLRVRGNESFVQWFQRNRADFELTPTHGVVEHGTLEEFKKHYVDGFYEAHLSVNLYAPRELIRKEFDAILKKKHKHPGISDAAGYRLNGKVDAAALELILKVLRADQSLPDEVIAMEVLKKQYKNVNTARSAVSQLRTKGHAIIRGVVQGCFPNPAAPANDWSGRQSTIMITQHRLSDESGE